MGDKGACKRLSSGVRGQVGWCIGVRKCTCVWVCTRAHMGVSLRRLPFRNGKRLNACRRLGRRLAWQVKPLLIQSLRRMTACVCAVARCIKPPTAYERWAAQCYRLGDHPTPSTTGTVTDWCRRRRVHVCVRTGEESGRQALLAEGIRGATGQRNERSVTHAMRASQWAAARPCEWQDDSDSRHACVCVCNTRSMGGAHCWTGSRRPTSGRPPNLGSPRRRRLAPGAGRPRATSGRAAGRRRRPGEAPRPAPQTCKQSGARSGRRRAGGRAALLLWLR